MLPDASRTNSRFGRTEAPPAVARGVDEIVTVPAAAGCTARPIRAAASSWAIGVLRVVFIFSVLPWGSYEAVLLGPNERLDDGDRVARPDRLRRDAVVRRRRPGEVVRRAGVDTLAADGGVVRGSGAHRGGVRHVRIHAQPVDHVVDDVAASVGVAGIHHRRL